jgi:hypothetical protein
VTVRDLLTRWNWKAALVSAVLRGAIFFTSALPAGAAAAVASLAVDLSFRIPAAGAYAAIVQAVRFLEPRWLSTTIVVLVMPAAAHAVEIAVHRAAGTPLLWRAVTASVALSAVSSAVELVLMRHDLLIVGPGAGSLASDVRRAWRLARAGGA